jgi:hypothetical protein
MDGGVLSTLERLETAPDLDVKDRAISALEQFSSVGNYRPGGWGVSWNSSH